ncbi:MAG TPA: hypothetical protein VKY38_03395 [Azoarcus sp.]|nr:hypothetical protein [Azoarcus sp.]
MSRCLIALAALLLLSACSVTPRDEHTPVEDEAVASDRSRDYLVGGWTIDVTFLGESRYRLNLRQRALTTGGDGEARRLFQDHAMQVAREQGFGDFSVLRYEEGVDSGLFFGRRFARGEVRLVRTDSWGLSAAPRSF